MIKSLKFFFLSFVLSLPFWWGTNVLEVNLKDFLFWVEIAKDPQIFTAQLNQKRIENELIPKNPLRNQEVEELKIEAKAVISVFVDSKGKEKVLFEKNSSSIMPIASLSKLMTAHIVLENYDPSQVIQVSKEAVLQETEFGKLKIGETFKTKDLLYPLLMESSNDAAYALSADYEGITNEDFLRLMNLEAKNLGLENTYFVNSTGLDPDDPKGAENYSTAEDLKKLTEYLLEKQPFLWEIMETLEKDLYDCDGVYHHKVLNNNELLRKKDKWNIQIIGGKTGWTPKAQGCLILFFKVPNSKGYLINVILGSGDRFGDMEKLVDWIHQAYTW